MKEKPTITFYTPEQRFWHMQIDSLESEIQRMKVQLDQIPLAVKFNEKALLLAREELRKIENPEKRKDI